MEIGCGARVRDFDRVDSEKARSELLRRIAAAHRRAEQEFARRRARIEGLIAAHASA